MVLLLVLLERLARFNQFDGVLADTRPKHSCTGSQMALFLAQMTLMDSVSNICLKPVGMMILSSFRKIAFSMVISSLKFQNSCRAVGQWLLFSGHPLKTTSLRSDSVGSLSVSCLICSSLVGEAESFLMMW